MTTIKSRINVSVPENVRIALADLAKRDQVPTATKAEHLIEIGLELEEDEVWDKIAASRDTKSTTFHIHSEIFNS